MVVGLDLSGGQLQAAQARAPELPLVHAAAETLPFRSETFDVVFCDHGGLRWSDPTYSVSEATRVLVPGGRLVFNTASPWLRVCYEGSSDRITAGLHHSYFDLGALDEGDGARTYTLTYGAWIRVFRANGLVVEDLIEPRSEPDALSSYYTCDSVDWAQSLARRKPLGDDGPSLERCAVGLDHVPTGGAENRVPKRGLPPIAAFD